MFLLQVLSSTSSVAHHETYLEAGSLPANCPLADGDSVVIKKANVASFVVANVRAKTPISENA